MSSRVGDVREFLGRFIVLPWLLSLAIAGYQAARPNALHQTLAAQTTGASSLAIDASDGSLLRARGGLFRSADHGRTWSALPIPAALDPGRIDEVATTAAAPASLYAAGDGSGVIRSDDRGRTWRAIQTGLPSLEVAAFAVHSVRPDTIYAWIAGRGVFLTEDGGRWRKVDDGPPASVAALAHSSLEGSMNTGWLYAATPQGPYLSMDCF